MGELVVDGLAVYRVTRLVTKDTITEPPRKAVLSWAWEPHVPDACATCGHQRIMHVGTGGVCITGSAPQSTRDRCTCQEWAGERPRMRHPKLATLIECPWCVSVYAAVGVVLARRFMNRAWLPLARVLAFSAIAGIAQTREID